MAGVIFRLLVGVVVVGSCFNLLLLCSNGKLGIIRPFDQW